MSKPDSRAAASLSEPVSVIPVEVIYPLAAEQILYTLAVPDGTVVQGAIERSGVLQRYPELVLDDLSVGIFGKLTTLGTVLRAKDRVEIYRPLLADPKEVRKQRAAEGARARKHR